ncbi:MAG: hypothetical protein DMD35_16635 [Gemmatimonadetes bacterium]|nr:MAG: hypothetical protein DMD35_16635 [Gemmatimonadota bacterium]
MNDETRTRFLTAIAAQLPVERIVEVHLFPAIRQGGMESGVAVVAVEPPPAAASVESAGDAVDVEPEVATSSSPRRYTVFSARYRHTLKGPDRGKWETSVTEEADAPLLTVDAVVRGVQRRSGDVDEIVRLTTDEVRAAIPAIAAP